MKSLLASLALLSLIGCTQVWLAPGGRIDSNAFNANDTYEILKEIHDKKYPDDKLLIVYRVFKDPDRNSLVDAWIIGTAKGNRLKYRIFSSTVPGASSGLRYSYTPQIIILSVEKISQ